MWMVTRIISELVQCMNSSTVILSYSVSQLFLSFSYLPTAKVGKTSLIMSLVGEEFPEEVSQKSSSPLLCYGQKVTLLMEALCMKAGGKSICWLSAFESICWPVFDYQGGNSMRFLHYDYNHRKILQFHWIWYYTVLLLSITMAFKEMRTEGSIKYIII